MLEKFIEEIIINSINIFRDILLDECLKCLLHILKFSIFRTNVTTDVNEEIENKHNRKCHSSNTDTSSKNVIILNGSRKIPKVSLKVKKVGRNIDDVS